jgi:uncharacterized membrane protein (UPF0136 family)
VRFEFIRINSKFALVAGRSDGRFFGWAGGLANGRSLAGVIIKRRNIMSNFFRCKSVKVFALNCQG